MAGDWLFVPGPGVDSSKFYSAVDIPGHGGDFNFTFGIRHGPQTVPGHVDSNNAVSIQVTDTDTINGQFASNCSYINWQPSTGEQYNFGAAWCRAWTPGCNYVKPPYMKGFAFWGTFGDYMVLQQAPQQAAVYGMVFGGTKPQVQVEVQGDDGTNYMVEAEINTVNQPFGPGFEYPWPYPGPFTTWKALLKPHAAGGNFRITSRCLNCVDRDPMFNAANISNVTFGDVWYCSGQSNMWLPVGHSFERNDTVDSIHEGQYNNIRIMAGNSGDQSDGIFNPWMTAEQSVVDPKGGVNYPLFNFGAACWYFAQKLADELQKAGKSVPIGLADTAVGGQRIEEYMDNTTISQCTDRLGENIPQWDGPLYGKLVVPFLDMTVKGFLWYQGENNMGGTKGNSIANVGYGCEMVHLVSAWRKNWSKVPGTTDPDAPFGIVTLASSGSEGGPNMGAMRWAQTGNYGVLPNPLIPNSFVAQAYDLDDPWGPNAGPCFEWQCCEAWHAKQNMTACNIGTNNNPKMCDLACAAAADTTPVMGGIHPRDKKPVGDRLGLAAYNTVYGGQGPTTGPTLSGCAVQDGSLVVQFNQTMLKGDTVIIQPYSQTLNMSYLEVMTDPTIFCVEVRKRNESCRSDCELYCPTWAGGSSITNNSALNGHDSQGWQPLNISMAGSSAIKADLSPLGEQPPVAVRYAWGLSECCDKTDPDLYVKYPCGPAPCPLMLGSKSFPANPFIAKIKDGKCECIAPQTCDGSVGQG